MLGALAQADVVLSAGLESARTRTRKGRSDLQDLWDLQDDFADTIDESWQRSMGRAVEQFARTPMTSSARITDGLRRLDRIAVKFGRSAKLAQYTDEMIRGLYAGGILFVYERWEDLQRGDNREADGDGFREPAQKAAPNADSVLANVAFTQADEAALAELNETALVWFRDRSGATYYDAEARKAIADKARRLIRDGADQVEIAEAMRLEAERLYGVGTFAGRGRSYWGGVAEHMATSAGVRGQLVEMEELGFTKFTLINPMDERTTRVCSMMNGKVAIVEDATQHNARLANATTPEQVKETHPFAPGGRTGLVEAALGRTLPQGVGVLSPADSATLGRAGVLVPPFHFRCRTYLDVYYEGPGSVPALDKPPASPDKR